MLKDLQAKNGIHGITFEVQPGEDLADPSGRRDIAVRMDCGGKGVCGKCRVIAHPTEHLSLPTEAEKEHLTPADLAAGYRLACQVHFLDRATVTIPDAYIDHREAVGKEGLVCTLGPDPVIRRIHLLPAPVPKVTEGVSPSLAGWIADRAEKTAGIRVRFNDADVLRKLSLPDLLQKETTLVHHEGHGVTSVLSGHRPRSLGAAFDIGTTTLAVYLCDLETGQVVASASGVNPQRGVGEDVISRISLCDREVEGLDQLRQLVVDGMNRLIRRCLDTAGADTDDIDEVTVVGNTTMGQILAGIHPHSIGVSPYFPAVDQVPDLRAEDLGLALSPATNVHVLPVVSGFVGGDTLGAVLADGLQDREEMSLLVDIGTNGELVLGNREALWATSCATGPALEGAQISCGMRAASGAIDRVRLDRNGQMQLDVMGKAGTLPLGICGSGIIDAVAALRRIGGLEAGGRFNPDFPGVVCDEKGIGRRYILVSPEASRTGGEIAITLKDVRQLQLAKAALAVGIDYLLDRVGVDALPRTVLTGAFGARFDWRSAVVIGMLPAAVAGGLVEPKMNLAGVGAAMALVNRCHRSRVAEIKSRTRFIELAGDSRFAMKFAHATAFPDPAPFKGLWS